MLTNSGCHQLLVVGGEQVEQGSVQDGQRESSSASSRGGASPHRRARPWTRPGRRASMTR
ncbi:hypothetical protein [Streptomyces sp. NBC_00572]|uniref:hypothetical protein n=1 Tax=Streptomyces sp. NBC_00572 TaxID=2903664 RepID=UPI002250923C|nr:hypothetical protein [Streptomyces sp. NBC_00572]MCX4987044.1 hypothetical protein [Streptomyces sp. NBC_00572]